MEVQPFSFSTTLSQEVADEILKTIETIPEAYRQPPAVDEIVDGLDEGFERLQAYAFTKGFALTTESKTTDRLRVECIHHHKNTRNRRLLAEDTARKGKKKSKEEVEANKKAGIRSKEHTKTQALDCPYALYISYRKRQQSWQIGITCDIHNHLPMPNPFAYHCHRHRNPGYHKAIELATAHR